MYYTIARKAELLQEFSLAVASSEGRIRGLPGNLYSQLLDAFPSITLESTRGLLIHAVLSSTKGVEEQLEILEFAPILWTLFPSYILKVFELDPVDGTLNVNNHKWHISFIANARPRPQYRCYRLLPSTEWSLFGRYDTLEAAMVDIVYQVTSVPAVPAINYTQLLELLEDVREGIPDNMEIKEAIGMLNGLATIPLYQLNHLEDEPYIDPFESPYDRLRTESAVLSERNAALLTNFTNPFLDVTREI